MSDEQTPGMEGNPVQDIPQSAQMPIMVHAQYVKDLSFENPNSPNALRGSEAPQMDVNIGVDARKLEDDKIKDLYEVIVNVRAVAERGNDAVFIAEMQYGMTVSLHNVPEDQHHPMLLIEIPRLAFPYVRQILSDVTIQGGFPPLLLNPVDFHALYVERFKDEIAASQQKAKDQTTVN